MASIRHNHILNRLRVAYFSYTISEVTRTLAAKLAIAARLYHFGAGLSFLDLQASLEARLKDIKQRGRNKRK
jgi:hypothetical protein